MYHPLVMSTYYPPISSFVTLSVSRLRQYYIQIALILVDSSWNEVDISDPLSYRVECVKHDPILKREVDLKLGMKF